MADYKEQIRLLEEELRNTPYNKATQHHIGLLKAKIAKLRAKELSRQTSRKKQEGFGIKKSGDATVVLAGYPSVGKSTLLNKLTNAKSSVGSYDFTTVDVVPGVMKYNYAKIQVLDVPGLIRGASQGVGRGREVLSMIRSADLILLLVDAEHPEQKQFIEEELYKSGIRINQKKPDVRIRKTVRGGIRIGSTVNLSKITLDAIRAVLKEFKIVNADVLIREDISIDQLIDVIESNKAYVPGITVVNKIDKLTSEQLAEVRAKIKPDLMISAEKGIGIAVLKQAIFDKLDLIRIFLKEPGKEPSKEPLIMFRGCTIRDVCNKLHKDFVAKFRFARLWGSAKFDGQRIHSLGRPLEDKDILELHIQ